MGARLAVDVGTVRIGVAVSDPRRTVAVPLGTVARAKDGSDLREIAATAAEREVDDVVVGLPVGLSGREGPAAASVREFTQRLADHLAPLPVLLVDERLTTTSAHQALHAAGRPGRRHRTVVDRTAAAILLQTVLDAEVGGGVGDDPGVRALGEPVPPRDGQADRSDA
ncbi:Holliday junction resolvase RuvX [Aquipuribacter hungaricus]|uniref:Putative pre-16S rRNA nuclease n=1 Tax=Aquipuribacter hungaricus TaxID=545624 RepID=A0ABV7WD19_9MICO